MNKQICHKCHLEFDADADNGCCHNPGCGWVNNARNNALLDRLNSDPYLIKAVEKINKAMDKNGRYE